MLDPEIDLGVCDDDGWVDPNDSTAVFMGDGDGIGAVVGEARPEERFWLWPCG